MLAAPNRGAIVVGYALAALVRALVTWTVLVDRGAGRRDAGRRRRGRPLRPGACWRCILNLAATLWACGVAMRVRSIQGGPLIQLPVFLVLFLAPVYVPLDLLSGWIHAVASVNPVTLLLEAGRGLISGEETLLIPAFAIAIVAGRGLRALGAGRAAERRGGRVSAAPQLDLTTRFRIPEMATWRSRTRLIALAACAGGAPRRRSRLGRREGLPATGSSRRTSGSTRRSSGPAPTAPGPRSPRYRRGRRFGACKIRRAPRRLEGARLRRQGQDGAEADRRPAAGHHLPLPLVHERRAPQLDRQLRDRARRPARRGRSASRSPATRTRSPRPARTTPTGTASRSGTGSAPRTTTSTC